nr:hypothetical protein [Candidatus Kryptobacter tengchongensis]
MKKIEAIKIRSRGKRCILEVNFEILSTFQRARCVKTQAKGIHIKKRYSSIGRFSILIPTVYLSLNPQIFAPTNI